MTALVYHAGKNSARWADWPQELRLGLQRTVYRQAAREVARAHEIKNIAKHCRASGVLPILIKGAALAYTHYASPEARPCADTDFFIEPGAVEQVLSIMRDLGYKVEPPIYKSHQFTCVKRWSGQTSNFIDIHWRVNNNPRFARILTYQEALERAVPIAELDACHGLSEEHALLLTCIHQTADTQYEPDRLIWLHDIYLLVSRMGPPELREFARLAAAKNVRHVCLDSLTKAGQCFGFTLPHDVEEMFMGGSPRPSGLRDRFAYSYLGLLNDDFRILRPRSIVGLLGELLLPASSSLLIKYNRKNRYWLPLLYPRHFYDKARQIVHDLFAETR